MIVDRTFHKWLTKVQFQCMGKSCPKNCCCEFDGFHSLLLPLCGVSHRDIVLLTKDVEALESLSKEDLIVRKEGYCFLRTHDNGLCYAYVDGGCSIYEHRPILCRAYPFYFDLFTGLCLDKSCPGVGKGHTCPEDLWQYYESAKKVYRFWLARMH